MRELFQIDWRIFMAGTETWLGGRNPYGQLSSEFSAGAFAYPPTALPWLALFVPLGGLGFYVWTSLQLLGWWLLIRRGLRSQLLLLCWAPMVLHLIEGQSTLPVVLALWGASRARSRGFLCGLVLAWALTKPQVAIIPVLWQLWQDRRSPLVWRMVGGTLLGTVALALPATLIEPGIWGQWIFSLGSYRHRILQMAAWQGFGLVILLPAAYFWHRSRHGGWHWWLSACVFPQTAYYGIVPLLPMLRPRQNNWTLAGLALAGILQGPPTTVMLPLILAGHMLAAWMIMGGPQRRPALTAVGSRTRPSKTMSSPHAAAQTDARSRIGDEASVGVIEVR